MSTKTTRPSLLAKLAFTTSHFNRKSGAHLNSTTAASSFFGPPMTLLSPLLFDRWAGPGPTAITAVDTVPITLLRPPLTFGVRLSYSSFRSQVSSSQIFSITYFSKIYLLSSITVLVPLHHRKRRKWRYIYESSPNSTRAHEGYHRTGRAYYPNTRQPHDRPRSTY